MKKKYAPPWGRKSRRTRARRKERARALVWQRSCSTCCRDSEAPSFLATNPTSPTANALRAAAKKQKMQLNKYLRIHFEQQTNKKGLTGDITELCSPSSDSSSLCRFAVRAAAQTLRHVLNMRAQSKFFQWAKEFCIASSSNFFRSTFFDKNERSLRT